MSMSELHGELEQFDELLHPFIMLIDFVQGLAPGHFEKGKNRWTYNPNFLSLTIHYKRRKHIVVFVRGWPSEYASMDHLPLVSCGSGSYSKCYVESVMQMDALLFYVRRSHELWNKGRGREGTRQRLVEE